MSARSAVLLGLLLALVGVSIAAAATGFGRDDQDRSPRLATADAYAAIRPDMVQERIDLEFLLIHARLDTNGELGEQLAALADRSDEQAAALAAIEPPSSIAGLVTVLQRAVADQAASLRLLARAARQRGPDAVRAAQPALRVQAERIRDARRRLETSFLIGS